MFTFREPRPNGLGRLVARRAAEAGGRVLDHLFFGIEVRHRIQAQGADRRLDERPLARAPAIPRRAGSGRPAARQRVAGHEAHDLAARDAEAEPLRPPP